MRSFLVFITEETLLGHTERLKERTIGNEVLGRKPDYDPSQDNIVRVRAHELRRRLEKYFASDGIDEPVIIAIPTGSYVPEFLLRKPAAAHVPPPEDKTPSVAQKRSAAIRPRLPLVGALVVVVVALLVLARYASENDRHTGAALPPGAMRDFWGQFFDRPDKELQVVYADAEFALWQDLSGKDLDLGEYLSRRYLDAQNGRLHELATRRFTSSVDLAVSVHLATLAAEFGGRVSPQFARDASTEYFQRGTNFFLLGSRRSNPWIEIYEPSLNFELKRDPVSGAPLFRNRAPRPHEALEYAIPEKLGSGEAGGEQRETTSYGLIALLKNSGNHSLVILDEGLNVQATQAVGDLVTNPQGLDILLRGIGHKYGTDVSPFEALIQITSLPEGYDNPHVVTFRMLPANPSMNR